MKRPAAISPLWALLWVAVPFVSSAGTFQIAPIRAKLSAKQPVAVVRMTNQTDTTTVVQSHVVAWTQVEGKDVYTKTSKVLVTPPIFKLAPGATQVVRVGLRGSPDAAHETAYRLFLAQVPSTANINGTGLQIALRFSLPVFVKPATPVAPKLAWTVQRKTPTTLILGATNSGTAHVQIRKLSLSLPGRTGHLLHKGGTYLLPGSSAHWTFQLKTPVMAGATISILASTDKGDFNADVVAKPLDSTQ